MNIPFEDFAKIELKVAKILSAERVEGSEKLLRLKVSLGEEERQILSGIAKTHEPESLVGKEVVIIANLEPRMMMGLESQGMILAAHSAEGAPVLLVPAEETPAGSHIS